MEHTVEILHTSFVTRDVKQFVLDRPEGLAFEPGQGVEIAIDRDGWRDEGRPFTPTSDPEAPAIELLIKEYPERDGVTRALHGLAPGASLQMSEPFGTITYQGPGLFVAGGAGVTPFLSILHELRREREDELAACSLLFSNKTPADVIREKELRELLGDRCHLTCTEESGPGYDDRRIGRAYLEEIVGDDLDRTFYVCGPTAFVEDVTGYLEAMGVAEGDVVVEE